MVRRLDEVFTRFDAIADSLGLEKIKTIGDAYMVAGGVPTSREDHAEAVCEMALRMREVVAYSREGARDPMLNVPIGVHTWHGRHAGGDREEEVHLRRVGRHP